jgi:hypothetical protein
MNLLGWSLIALAAISFVAVLIAVILLFRGSKSDQDTPHGLSHQRGSVTTSSLKDDRAEQ